MPPRRAEPNPTAALQMLGEQAALRREQLEQYDDAPSFSDSHDASESICPVMDKFFAENGNQAIMDMTNFISSEFNAIWNQFQHTIVLKYNTGRGSKSPIKENDLLFMTLAFLKHGAKWDMMAYFFGFKAPTFEKRVTDMISIIYDFSYSRFVAKYATRFTMDRLIADNKLFKNYKMCRYATDVTFQQSFRPGGSLEEVKKYFSGKHKLYGYKVEVSILPNGLSISASKHHPGSVSDIEIMRDMLAFHDDALEKSDEEKGITDIGPVSDKYPGSWGLLLDKGYTGMEAEARAIIPKKKPQGGYQSISDKKENEANASDRVIVENVFGRQGILWAVLSSKYRWAEENYDKIFKLTVALTNNHVQWHPLRDEDGKTYERYLKRLNDIAESGVKKRQRAQVAYRKKRKRVMERILPGNHAEGEVAGLFDEDDEEDSN